MVLFLTFFIGDTTADVVVESFAQVVALILTPILAIVFVFDANQTLFSSHNKTLEKYNVKTMNARID
jgi:hypothetical protein